MGIAENLTKNLQLRRLTDEHNVVGIQGPAGVGKSTLGLISALTLDAKFGLGNVHYNRDEWDQITRAPKGSVFLLDEGANVAMNRTWQDRSQVKLMQVLNMIRQRNHTLIWATPNLQRLDIVLREDLLTHKVNCYRRGKARVLTPGFNREGEREGWKLWPGILTWNSIKGHPLWKPYVQAKAANFTKASNSISQDALAHGFASEPRILETSNLQPGGESTGEVGRDPLQIGVQD